MGEEKQGLGTGSDGGAVILAEGIDEDGCIRNLRARSWMNLRVSKGREGERAVGY